MGVLKVNGKITRSGSGSVSQRHGSADPEHCFKNYKAGILNPQISLDAKDEAVGEDTVEDLCSVLLPLLLLLPPVLNSASHPRQPPPTGNAAEG